MHFIIKIDRQKTIIKYSFKVLGILAVLSPLTATQISGQIPTRQQAEQILQNPDQAQLVLDRIRASGLTPDQIRAQLRSAGLPSGMLDAYLGIESDTLLAPEPGQDIIEAMRVLGLGDFSAQDSLLLAGDTTALRLYRDSLRLDSIRTAELEPKELKLFGLETFRQPTTLFQPTPSGPVSPSYILGPGDELVLFLTGEVELARQLTVTGEGFVVIPEVGRISVNGLSMEQLRALLRTRLAQSYSGIRTGSTQFDLTVARVRLITVRVAGEVNRPGSYTLAATASPLSALYEAAGLTERANFRQISILRANQLIGTYDLYDYLLTGAVTADVSLQTGDVVFVPIAGPRVAIAGEVRRPAIYELRRDESLADLIDAAGGLTARAYVGNATISRILPASERVVPGRDRTVITVDLQNVISGANVPMFDDDSVTIFRISDRETASASISGSVWQPGSYQLTPGMRLWDLIQASGGLKPETYSGRVQIRRLRPDSTSYLLGVVLPTDGTPPANDPLLQEQDEVTVFSLTTFRPTRTINVLGEIHEPGELDFADSMTLRDAILQAGGLTDEAFLVFAEVSRVLHEPTEGGDSLAQTFRVPMDSSYVFDPTAYVRRPVGADAAPDFILEPNDNVFIRRQPGLEELQNVIVTGEVRFPGHYAIPSKGTRLADLIVQAGGITDQAYANGIRFFRAQGGAGRISIDLPSVLQNPDHRDNIELALGDSIHIPRFVPTVRVEGAVLSPTSVTFVPNKGTNYYVDAAGGYTRLADKGRTFVQQANGLIQRKGTRPQPGAIVVVPEKDPDDTGINVAVLLSGIAQALTALTTIVILLDRVVLNNP